MLKRDRDQTELTRSSFNHMSKRVKRLKLQAQIFALETKKQKKKVTKISRHYTR